MISRVATSTGAAPSSSLATTSYLAANPASNSSSTSSSTSPVPSSSSSRASSTSGTATQATLTDVASPDPSLAPSSPVPSSSSSSSKRAPPSRSSTMPYSGPSGRTGTHLPKGLLFDWVRPTEITQCHAIERASFIPDDRATKERMQYRQKVAPHLFLGAYIPVPPPKVAGPLSVGHQSTPRRLIGYINATAAASMSARALSEHLVSDEEQGIEAWMVCLHAIVVDEPFRRKGLGLRLLEEYMMRLRRAEEGRGEARKGELEKPRGYECVGLICHEETLPFFLKAGFKIRGPSHIRAGSGEWIELRRYILHTHQVQADEKQKAQEQEAEEMRKKRAMSVASSSSSSSRGAGPPERRSTLQVVTEGGGSTSWAANGITASPTEEDEDAFNSIAMTTPKSSQPSAPASAPPQGSSMSSSGSNNGGLSGFSQADLLAALSASTPSYKPGTNPSQPFSSILGQTLAGKTFVEDAFLALEARLVDKGNGDSADGQGTNLAEIWCPREECGCKIVAKGMAMWELAESGPLSQPDVDLPSSSSLPPTPQPPPAPASHIRALKERRDGVRSTLPGAPPSAECLTPIRPFWSLVSAMSFDNIAFSKDAEWTMPTSSAANEGALSGSSSGEEESAPSSRKRGVPIVRRSTFRSSSGSGGPGSRPMSPPQAGSGRPSSPPSAGRGTAPFGRGGAGSGVGKGRPMSSGRGASSAASPRSFSSASTATVEGASPPDNAPPPAPPSLTVKYLLCPNCDTGPLGYTIVPESLKAGKMGLQVGEGINASNGGAGGGPPPPREIQVFLVAAERVRYRYVK